MHHSILLRSEVNVSHLLDWKSIHVSPEGDDSSRHRSSENSQYSRPADPGSDLYAQASEPLSDQLGCGFFLIGELGSLVDLSPCLDNLRLYLSSLFKKVYHLSATFMMLRQVTQH